MMKAFFQKIYSKMKPYIGYIAAFLGVILGFLLLKPKKHYSAADELKQQQDVRGEKADEILNETEELTKSTDQKIKDVMQKRKERRGL